jgi:hypothetical protein
MANENTSVSPFNSSFAITDNVSTSESITVEVTLSGPLQGTLTIPGFTFNAASKEWKFTGTAATATTDLQGATFTSALVLMGTAPSVTVIVTAADATTGAANAATDSNTVITVTGTTAAPTLGAGVEPLPPIPNNIALASDTGLTVSAFLNATDTDSDALGIAVIGVTDSSVADGIWQYELSGSMTWVNIDPGTSAASAVLLGPNATVRFAPAAGFTGTPTLTYLAWDVGGGGKPGDEFDLSASPNAFGIVVSTTSENLSVQVVPPLEINGAGPSMISDTGVDQPFSSSFAIVNNDNSGGDVTVTITPTGNALGTLAISGFTANSDGTWSFTGLASDATSDLQSATFTPDLVLNGAAPMLTLGVGVVETSDNTVTASDSLTVITVNGTTDPPTAAAGNPLPTIVNTISATDNTGATVSSILNATTTDGDMLGIAVTAADDANGTWEYFLTGTPGAVWTPISGVGAATALLLAPNDLVRFVPSDGFVGTATLSYAAWDPGSGGTAGGTADLTTNPNDMLFSAAPPVSSSISVLQPLVIGGTAPLPISDAPTPSSPLASLSITDNVSSGTNVTLSVTTSGNALGAFSIPGFTQSGDTWTFSGALSTGLADLQAATFTPDHVLSGDQPTLTLSLTVTDGSDSATDATTVITVTGSTAAPVIDAGNPLPSELNTATDPAGSAVSALLKLDSTNTNTDSLGIAITAVDDTNGTWEYFLTGTPGAVWTPISGVGTGTALLLAPTDLVRFVPNSTFVGTASLSYQAWDTTSGGMAGGTADLTTNPNDMVFSAAPPVSSSISVLQPIAIGGTAPLPLSDAPTPSSPLAGLTITDNVSSGTNVTLSVTTSGNALGAFSIPGFTQSGDTWTFSGALSTGLADLQAATFTPDHVLSGDQPTLTLSLTVTDGSDSATDATTVITVTGSTAAPTVAAGNPLTAIVAGSATNGGTQVQSLLSATGATGDALGIAITGVDDTNGLWQYSMDGGTTWIAFTKGGTGGAAIGATTALFPTTAVLLSSSDLVRFVPTDATFTGIASITYVAWDTTSGGSNGATANVSTNPHDMVFSSASATSKIPVIGPPSVPSQTILVPVGTANGNTVGTVTAGETAFSFLSSLGDAIPAVTYTLPLTGGNSSGAFSIDSATGAITVVNSAALVYSATPLLLTVTASYTTSLTGATQTLTSQQANTTTVELWQVTTSATQISSSASTTLTVNIQFDGPATQTFPVAVNWGDGSVLNQSLTPGTYNFTHIYPTNPDKANPAAAIPIDVTVTDFQDHSIAANTQAPVPGTGFPDIAIVPQTTSSVVLVTPQVLTDSQVAVPPLEPVATQENDLGLAPAEVVTTTGRQVSLRIVSASGAEGDDINVPDPDQALNDLPKLFSQLPDGRYRVYLSEDGRTRLVIDVVVRQGRPVDPSEDSNGTSERPSTGEIQYGGADNVAADTAGKQSTGSPQPSTTGPSLPQLPPPPVAPVNGQQPSASTSDGAKTAPGFDAEVVPSSKSALPVSKPAPDVGAGTSFERHGAPGHQSWEAAAAGVGVAALLMESRSQLARERSERVDELMSHSNRKTFSAAARLARKLRRAVKE